MLLRNARVGAVLVDVSLLADRIVGIRPVGGAAGARGTSARVEATEAVDLDGRWLIPGLWDNHTHFDQWALQSSRLDVSAATSARQTADLIASAPRVPDELVVAVGFRDGLWPDAPSRAVLDAAAPGPVAVVSGDLHSVWLNSAALAQFGHAAHPTGLLREDDAFEVVRRLDATTDDELDGLAQRAAVRAAALGVVGVVDYEMVDNAPRWQRRASRRRLPIRVEFGIYREHLELAVARGLRTGEGIAPRVTVGNLKIIIDGSLNTRTAYCYDPYPGLTGEESNGVLTVPPDELYDTLEHAARVGISASVHAIGDHANTVALDAFERLGRALPANVIGPGNRAVLADRIEHAQLIAERDLARFARLGVAASVQPDHAMDDRDVAERYWAGRTDRSFPLRSLLDSGASLLLGSDAPVSPLDPMRAIGAAVTRSRDGRAPWHPEQAITVAEAITASTRNRVAVGERADLVVLDGDPELLGSRVPAVAATLVGGEFSHRAF